jgi:hypothetical protein
LVIGEIKTEDFLVEMLGFHIDFNEPKFIFGKVVSALQHMQPFEHRVSN